MERLKQDVLDALRFLRFVAVRLRDDRCMEMAASLTFTTLLSLVPLITIMLTVFAAFPVFSDMSSAIKSYVLSNMLPETGGRMITRYVEQFAQSASRLTAVGIVFLGIAAMMMMMTIDNAFHRIYRVSRQRKLVQRILVYWAVITLAPLLVGASLSLTSWLTSVSAGYAQHVPFGGISILKVFPLILTAAAFTLLFSVVPNRYVPIRHALIGGVIAAFAFESMNLAFAYYITNFPSYKLVYGAFASLPIFLLWIYLSWLMLLFGAIISSAIPHWRSEHSFGKDQATQLYFALHMLKFMDEGLKTGEVQVLHSLSRQLRLGYEDVEHILQKLGDAKIVSKLSEQGWGMVRAPEYVTVSELMRLFLLDTSGMPRQAADPHITAWFTALEQRMHGSEQQTLRDIWATPV
jgi:membrane protein